MIARFLPTDRADVARPIGGPVAAVFILVGACVGLALLDPTGGPPLCPFKALTGLDCPGCGTTRAAHQMLTGHLVHAADLNVFAFIVLPLVAWSLFAALTKGFGGPSLPTLRPPRWQIWTALGVVCVFWVVRNIPVAPFSWLGTGT